MSTTISNNKVNFIETELALFDIQQRLENLDSDDTQGLQIELAGLRLSFEQAVAAGEFKTALEMQKLRKQYAPAQNSKKDTISAANAIVVETDYLVESAAIAGDFDTAFEAADWQLGAIEGEDHTVGLYVSHQRHGLELRQKLSVARQNLMNTDAYFSEDTLLELKEVVQEALDADHLEIAFETQQCRYDHVPTKDTADEEHHEKNSIVMEVEHITKAALIKGDKDLAFRATSWQCNSLKGNNHPARQELQHLLEEMKPESSAEEILAHFKTGFAKDESFYSYRPSERLAA